MQWWTSQYYSGRNPRISRSYKSHQFQLFFTPPLITTNMLFSISPRMSNKFSKENSGILWELPSNKFLAHSYLDHDSVREFLTETTTDLIDLKTHLFPTRSHFPDCGIVKVNPHFELRVKEEGGVVFSVVGHDPYQLMKRASGGWVVTAVEYVGQTQGGAKGAWREIK